MDWITSDLNTMLYHEKMIHTCNKILQFLVSEYFTKEKNEEMIKREPDGNSDAGYANYDD